MKPRNINDRNLFTIDLLKGRGIPPRSGPARIIIAMTTVLVPMFIALVLFGLYLHNEVEAKINQQEVVKIQDKTFEYSSDVKMQKNLEREAFLYGSCLAEIKKHIGKYYQWSPVLVTLIHEMPDSVVLTGLNVEHEIIQQEAPKENPVNMTAITKLVVKVSNLGQGGYDEEIKDFRNRLYASSMFGSKLKDIAFSRQTQDEGGKETISYQIECILKPGQ